MVNEKNAISTQRLFLLVRYNLIFLRRTLFIYLCALNVDDLYLKLETKQNDVERINGMSNDYSTKT